MSINFENVIFANNGASGRVDIGLIGMEVATGHADFNIMAMKTGVTVGTATLDITCKSEANVREILYNACMAISDASEVYEEHITFGKHSA